MTFLSLKSRMHLQHNKHLHTHNSIFCIDNVHMYYLSPSTFDLGAPNQDEINEYNRCQHGWRYAKNRLVKVQGSAGQGTVMQSNKTVRFHTVWIFTELFCHAIHSLWVGGSWLAPLRWEMRLFGVPPLFDTTIATRIQWGSAKCSTNFLLRPVCLR